MTSIKRKRKKVNPLVKCLRCDYSWSPRTEDLPIVCAKCKSAYWDVPKTKWLKSDEK